MATVEKSVTKRRAPSVSIQEFIVAMKEIIDSGVEKEDPDNLQKLANRIGHTKEGTKQKIQQSKSRFPQIKLVVDLEYFKEPRKPRKPSSRKITNADMNEFLSELFGTPVEELEEALDA
jgi:hypothetical protein